MTSIIETHEEAQLNSTPDKMLPLLGSLERWFSEGRHLPDNPILGNLRAMIKRLKLLSDADYFARRTLRCIYKMVHPDLRDDPDALVPPHTRTRMVRVYTDTQNGGVSIESDEPFGPVKVMIGLDDRGLRVTIVGPEIVNGYPAMVAWVHRDGLEIDQMHRSPLHDQTAGWNIENH